MVMLYLSHNDPYERVPAINGSVYTSVTTTRTNAVPTINGCVIPQSQRPVRTPYQRLMVLLYLSHNDPYKRCTND